MTQKIHIIESFVAIGGFVHNEGGRASQLRNLSIEEYREEKRAHAAQPICAISALIAGRTTNRSPTSCCLNDGRTERPCGWSRSGSGSRD